MPIGPIAVNQSTFNDMKSIRIEMVMMMRMKYLTVEKT